MPSGTEKLSSLRNLMRKVAVSEKKTGIDAYIVTSSDAHGSEYVQDRDKRREFISGFKGSAGTAVITHDKALLWTDGRYYNQASQELDPISSWTLMKEGLLDTPTIGKWLRTNLPADSHIGVDPHYIDESTASSIKDALFGQHLVPIQSNLIDLVWGDSQPSPVLNEIVPLNLIYTGKTSGDKVKECFVEMQKNSVSALVLTALDEIAYLLNWRGTDITYNPLFLSFVVLYDKKVYIFVKEDRVSGDARQQLKDENVDFEVHPYEDVRGFFRKLCGDRKCERVWIPKSSNYGLHMDCGDVPTLKTMTPPKLMKAVKNETEIAGMKLAHIKDAVGMVKYFAWLEDKILNYSDADSPVTEVSGLQQLEKFRREMENYKGPSFHTISSAGKHGAVIHYQPSAETDMPITAKELYLCDTGSQFPEGTTDTTRTLHFGQPSEFEKECFTRVFKGQYNLATAKFPLGLKGNYLDPYARKYLWEAGLDYGHGTGHGVGCHMNVHEYPSTITWKPAPDDIGLFPGMFTSNEPGYYEDGKFGIRIENVELVVKTTSRSSKEFCTFETVTVVPIQTKLLNISMLTEDEVEYLNNYHQKCLRTLKPYLQGPENSQAMAWLKKETEPIKK